MAASSAIERELERLVPSFVDLRVKRIFTQNEIGGIVRQIRQFETFVRGSCKNKNDFLEYIAYCTTIESLRLARTRKAGFADAAVRASSFIPHILKLYGRLCAAWPDDCVLWRQRLDFCLEAGAVGSFLHVLYRALQLHPLEIDFWLLAADRELQQGSLVACRRLLLTALRHLPDSGRLWAELLQLELAVVVAYFSSPDPARTPDEDVGKNVAGKNVSEDKDESVGELERNRQALYKQTADNTPACAAVSLVSHRQSGQTQFDHCLLIFTTATQQLVKVRQRQTFLCRAYLSLADIVRKCVKIDGLDKFATAVETQITSCNSPACLMLTWKNDALAHSNEPIHLSQSLAFLSKNPVQDDPHLTSITNVHFLCFISNVWGNSSELSLEIVSPVLESLRTDLKGYSDPLGLTLAHIVPPLATAEAGVATKIAAAVGRLVWRDTKETAAADLLLLTDDRMEWLGRERELLKNAGRKCSSGAEEDYMLATESIEEQIQAFQNEIAGELKDAFTTTDAISTYLLGQDDCRTIRLLIGVLLELCGSVEDCLKLLETVEQAGSANNVTRTGDLAAVGGRVDEARVNLAIVREQLTECKTPGKVCERLSAFQHRGSRVSNETARALISWFAAVIHKSPSLFSGNSLIKCFGRFPASLLRICCDIVTVSSRDMLTDVAIGLVDVLPLQLFSHFFPTSTTPAPSLDETFVKCTSLIPIEKFALQQSLYIRAIALRSRSLLDTAGPAAGFAGGEGVDAGKAGACEVRGDFEVDDVRSAVSGLPDKIESVVLQTDRFSPASEAISTAVESLQTLVEAGAEAVVKYRQKCAAASTLADPLTPAEVVLFYIKMRALCAAWVAACGEPYDAPAWELPAHWRQTMSAKELRVANIARLRLLK